MDGNEVRDLIDAFLPPTLKIRQVGGLVRLGRDGDGGYLVSKDDVQRSNVLISLGISNDWSFERDFFSRSNIPILAFDGSVTGLKILKNVFKNLMTFYRIKRLFSSIFNFIDFLLFFRGQKRFISKYVGLKAVDCDNYVGLDEILESVDYGTIFLKIDIEGAEYRCLEILQNFEMRISGLVIEFHDCDLHLASIERFVERFPLKLVHIHANNYAPVRSEDRLPLVLEMTFSRFGVECGGGPCLPHPLDMPNNKAVREIAVNFIP